MYCQSVRNSSKLEFDFFSSMKNPPNMISMNCITISKCCNKQAQNIVSKEQIFNLNGRVVGTNSTKF